MTDEVDVLVIGAGPAGSTTAAVLCKYNPGLRVQLVEQAAFPRHHVGESLILELNRILMDMGALDAVARAGFVKKSGVTFIWGEDRTPWKLLFNDGRAQELRGDPHDIFTHSWHVERARYDATLLDVARGHGADVRRSRCAELLSDASGRVTGARRIDPDGNAREVHARFVVDAGGRASLLARKIGRRVFDPLLRNVAVYGYWRGAELDPAYSIGWDPTQIVVVSVPAGWLWYIPLAPGLVSVGVVTSHERFQSRAHESLEDFYRAHVGSSPEVAAWLARAELVDFPGAARRVLTEVDFNYFHEGMSAPGCALVGDAAGFVDPVFSVGVFLSQTGGQLLAYALGTLLRGDGAMDERRLLGAYEQHLRVNLDAFRAMAYVFYGLNSTQGDWWRRARELIRAQALPDDITDHDAFFAVITGFGVNVTLFNEAMNFMAQGFGAKVADALLRGPRHARAGGVAPPVRRDLARNARPRITRAYTHAPSAVPIEGTGRMVPMNRVEFAPAPGAKDHDAFPRHLFVPDELTPLLARLDGSASVADLVHQVSSRGTSPSRAEEVLQNLLRSLEALRAIEVPAP